MIFLTSIVTPSPVLIFWHSTKFLLLTFGPIFLPKLAAYYRSIRASSAHAPPPRPLPSSAQISLNVLFFTSFLFLLATFLSPSSNVFTLTSSRPAIPTDVLFTRLTLSRSDGILSPAEELLKGKLTTPAARSIYFHYGPDALTSCSFCDVDEPKSYLLYTLP